MASRPGAGSMGEACSPNFPLAASSPRPSRLLSPSVVRSPTPRFSSSHANLMTEEHVCSPAPRLLSPSVVRSPAACISTGVEFRTPTAATSDTSEGSDDSELLMTVSCSYEHMRPIGSLPPSAIMPGILKVCQA